jgi:hypothetical protein
MSFPDFDDLWASLTPSYRMHGKLIAALPIAEHDRLKAAVRTQLSIEATGRVAFASLANAAKASVP